MKLIKTKDTNTFFNKLENCYTGKFEYGNGAYWYRDINGILTRRDRGQKYIWGKTYSKYHL